MKRLHSFIFLLILFTGVLASCSKDIVGRTENIAALNPADVDIDAGAWKTVLLGRPDTFAINAPALTNSPAYIAELNEIKGLQQNMSS